MSTEDWSLAREAVEVFGLLHEATKEMSGEHYVTGAKVIPMVKNLMGCYAEETRRQRNQGNDLKHRLCEGLLEQLNRRFCFVEDVRELALATLTDPRFKKQGFRSKEKADRAVRWLRQELDMTEAPSEEEETGGGSQVPRETSSSMDLWSKFDSEVASRRALPTPTSDTKEVELKRYFELPNVPRQTDPIHW